MLKKIVFILTLVLLTGFSFAQPTGAPMTGDVTIVDGTDLEQILGQVVDETTQQLGSGASIGTVFASPAFLTLLFGLLGAVVTLFTTDGLKLSSSWIRGRKTQLIAAIISLLSAGVGGYFGLANVAGVSGVEGALLAALSALGSFGVAVGAHEKSRYAETGLRKPQRKAGAVVADTVLEGLVLAGKVLPPPFQLAPELIRGLYAAHGYKFVKDLIDRQRALSEAELKDAGDAWEKEQAAKPAVVTTGGAK